MRTPSLKFKLKKYNMGGYLRFDDGGEFEAYQNDPSVQKIFSQRQQANDFTNVLATGANAIPGIGSIVSAGLKIGQGIGKATTDQYGIYKSKGAEVVDNLLDPSKSIGDFSHIHNFNDVVNHFSLGLLGTNSDQDKLKKEKDLAMKRAYTNQVDINNQAGARSRAAIGGFQAAPYGRKGMKFRARTKFSQPC